MTERSTIEFALAPERIIALDNVHNFRDLGGYATADGGTTRWRMVFRADGLQRLSTDDVDTLRPLGLRSVIDLRTPAELAEHGTFPLDAHPLAFHHLSILDATWRDQQRATDVDELTFLVDAYRDMLKVGADRFVAAFEVLAQPDALPAVFHCAAGKDRTGLLAALLLGALGVDDDDIADDYALTAEAMVRMMEWSAVHRPELAARFASAPSAMLAANRGAMVRILADLRSAHGSVRNAVLALGVSEATLDILDEALVGH